MTDASAERKRRAVIAAEFALADLPALLRELARLPPGGPLYIGSYGINDSASEQIHELPNAAYAPMFTIPSPPAWDSDSLQPAAGPRAPRAPFRDVVAALGRMSARRRISTGLSIGRRFRDRIADARARGIEVDTWQFDEIHGECVGAAGRPVRQFTAAILRGMGGGGPGAAHSFLPGIVWVAHSAMPLIEERSDPERARFWRSLANAALFFVGEEFPSFRLSPATAAAQYGTGQRALARSRGYRRALAPRYVVGITPGWRPLPGLGGKTPRMTRSDVNEWRNSYLRLRSQASPAGVGVFDWTHENSARIVVRDTVMALQRVVTNA